MIRPSARVVLAFKVLVTLVLVCVIFYFANWRQFWSMLTTANPFYVAVVFMLMVLCVSLSAWKWQCLLRIHGARFDFWRLHRWYFTAMFFNNFLPTSIGGDGYRIWRTINNDRSRTSAVLAVLVERLSGILTLLAIGLLGALIGWFMHANRLSVYFAACGLVGVVLGLVILYWLVRLDGLQKLRDWPRLPAKLKSVIDHLDDYWQSPAQSIQAVGVISVIFHAVSLFWMGLLLTAMGDSIALSDLALVAAVLSIVAVVPISINGIGVVDGSFIWLTGQYGVSYEAALGAMLLQRALLIPISLLGAWFYFRDGGNKQGRDWSDSRGYD